MPSVVGGQGDVVTALKYDRLAPGCGQLGADQCVEHQGLPRELHLAARRLQPCHAVLQHPISLREAASYVFDCSELL